MLFYITYFNKNCNLRAYSQNESCLDEDSMGSGGDLLQEHGDLAHS